MERIRFPAASRKGHDAVEAIKAIIDGVQGAYLSWRQPGGGAVSTARRHSAGMRKLDMAVHPDEAERSHLPPRRR